MTYTSRTLAGTMLALCALAAGQSATAGAAAPASRVPANRVIVQQGEDPVLAMLAAHDAIRATALSAAWRASGRVPNAPPAITGGSVSAATLRVGDPSAYPTINFSYQTDSPGLSYVSFTFASPSGKTFYSASYSAPAYTESGAMRFRNPTTPSLWSQPGVWTLVTMSITDNAGATVTYDKRQIASLFTGGIYTVANTGVEDSEPPKIQRGEIPNPTVVLSDRYPLLKATITASDAGSGLQGGFVLVQPPGVTYYYYEDVALDSPEPRAKIDASTQFLSGDPTGTWTIKGYLVCDFAENCAGSTQPADVIKLFGIDTFTVTP